MSRNRNYTCHQRDRSIRRVKRFTSRWGQVPGEIAIKRMASHRGICSCGICKPWKHAGGNGYRRWDGVRHMMLNEAAGS